MIKSLEIGQIILPLDSGNFLVKNMGPQFRNKFAHTEIGNGKSILWITGEKEPSSPAVVLAYASFIANNLRGDYERHREELESIPLGQEA
jgi:hypothetical protein